MPESNSTPTVTLEAGVALRAFDNGDLMIFRCGLEGFVKLNAVEVDMLRHFLAALK
jgi:hypothetical protein